MQIDEPIYYSELSNKYETKEEIANYLCDRCNALGEKILKEI